MSRTIGLELTVDVLNSWAFVVRPPVGQVRVEEGSIFGFILFLTLKGTSIPIVDVTTTPVPTTSVSTTVPVIVHYDNLTLNNTVLVIPSGQMVVVEGELVIDDLKTVDGVDSEGNAVKIVISRTSEFKILDKNSGIVLSTNNIPYGSHIFVSGKKQVKKGDVICQWDPYNGVIVSEFGGKAVFEDLIEGVTYQVEMDEQTGFKEKVISDSKKKRVILQAIY